MVNFGWLQPILNIVPSENVNFGRNGPKLNLVLKWGDSCAAWECNFGRFGPNNTVVLLRWSTSVKIDRTWLLCCWDGQLRSIWTKCDSCAEWGGQLRSISIKCDSCAVEMVNFGRFQAKLNLVLSDNVNFGRFWPKLNLVLSEEVNFGRFWPKLNLVLSENVNFGQFWPKLNFVPSEKVNFGRFWAKLNLVLSENVDFGRFNFGWFNFGQFNFGRFTIYIEIWHTGIWWFEDIQWRGIIYMTGGIIYMTGTAYIDFLRLSMFNVDERLPIIPTIFAQSASHQVTKGTCTSQRVTWMTLLISTGEPP